jgi:hypothetical protein
MGVVANHHRFDMDFARSKIVEFLNSSGKEFSESNPLQQFRN